MKSISVIIPFHRELDELSNAVKSVNNQTLPNDFRFEIIIGNDSRFSNEKIKELLMKICDAKHIIKVEKNNLEKGAGNARNIAMQNATGEYISFLDSDDIWKKEKILKQLAYITHDADFISTGYEIKNKKLKILPAKKSQFKENIFFSFRPLGTSTVLAKTHYLKSCKFKNIKFCQDIVFWSEVFSKYPNINYKSIDESLVYYSDEGRTSKSSILDFIFFYWSATKEANLKTIDRFKAIAIYIIRGFYNLILRKQINFLINRFKN